jgi:hypothetical protein
MSVVLHVDTIFYLFTANIDEYLSMSILQYTEPPIYMLILLHICPHCIWL